MFSLLCAVMLDQSPAGSSVLQLRVFYLFGPGGFVAGVDRVLVVIELLLLSRSRLLLLLLLEGNQVRSLLLELSLQPLGLPLLLQLLPLILLQENTER